MKHLIFLSLCWFIAGYCMCAIVNEVPAYPQCLIIIGIFTMSCLIFVAGERY